MNLSKSLIFSALVLVSSNALADFNFCNKTDAKIVSIAFGNYKDDKVQTRGWFNIAKDTCVTILKGDITKEPSNLFYFYGESDDRKLLWEGKNELCVKYPGPFTFSDASGECKSGLKKKFRLVTADDHKDYTINLTNKEDKSFSSQDQGESFGLDLFEGVTEENFSSDQ